MAANLDEILSNRFSVPTAENTEMIKSTEIQNLEINTEIVIESNITELMKNKTEEDSLLYKERNTTRESEKIENEINNININNENSFSNFSSLSTDSETFTLPLSLPISTPSFSSSVLPVPRNVSTDISTNTNTNAHTNTNANANANRNTSTDVNHSTNLSKANVLSSGVVQFEDSIVICGSDSDILLQAMILATRFPNIAVLQSGEI